jgi:hypothetical protein
MRPKACVFGAPKAERDGAKPQGLLRRWRERNGARSSTRKIGRVCVIPPSRPIRRGAQTALGFALLSRHSATSIIAGSKSQPNSRSAPSAACGRLGLNRTLDMEPAAPEHRFGCVKRGRDAHVAPQQSEHWRSSALHDADGPPVIQCPLPAIAG